MADDEDTLLALDAFCVVKLKQQRRKRRFWLHPINANRDSQGEDYDNLILKLRRDSFLFRHYFRISTNEFDQLLCHIGPAILIFASR